MILPSKIMLKYHISLSSISGWGEFSQLTPLQLSHELEQSKPYFLQLHLIVVHSDLQLQRIIARRWSGAGALFVGIATSLLFFKAQPKFSGSSVELLPLHTWIWQNTRKLWKYAAADVGGKVWGCTALKALKILSWNVFTRSWLSSTWFSTVQLNNCVLSTLNNRL